MIKAQHNHLALWLFDRYILRLMRNHFHSFQLLGAIEPIDPTAPLLLLPNHASWWDGFFIYLLNRHFFQRHLYMMMQEEQLRRFWFFSKVGAYSIQPGNQDSVDESLEYTATLLQSSDKPPAVCIFPQGKLMPWGKRPVIFKPGVRQILERATSPVQVLLVATRIEYTSSQHADVFFQLSECYRFNNTILPDMVALSSKMESMLQLLQTSISYGEQGTIFLNGRQQKHE
ncbi:lysophospholipid acyltransferase family protein [candidate division KSB1 bacterium]|nr:lysophospholipid acyltransferase family protein [candidate division KSB1 bacterium]